MMGLQLLYLIDVHDCQEILHMFILPPGKDDIEFVQG